MSSWRLRREHEDDYDDAEDVSSERQEALCRLPKSRWPTKDRDLPLVRRAWLAVADELLEFEDNGVKRWLARVRSSFAVRRVVITLAQAQCLAALDDAEPKGHTLAAALEVALLAAPPVAAAVPLLSKARLLKPTSADLTAKTSFFPAGALAGFEVGRTSNNNKGGRDDKDGNKDRGPKDRDKAKTCLQCGASGWTPAHACKDADLLAFAKAHPRKSGF